MAMGEEIKSKLDTLLHPNKRIAIGLSIVAALIASFGIYYALNINKSKDASQSQSNPTPTATINAVTALGRLEPQGEVVEVSASPNLGGAKIARILVEEGDIVRANQVIAILDILNLKQAEKEVADRQLKVAQANLAIVKAGAKTGEIKAQEAEIRKLEAQLTTETISKQTDIDRLKAQLSTETQERQATINRLQSSLNNARVEYERYQKLASEGAESLSVLDAKKTTLETAQASLTEAKASLSRTVATLNEQIRQAEALLVQTKATLQEQVDGAKAELDRIAEVRPVDIVKAEAEVEEATANLKQKQADLDLAQVKAPKAGRVLKVNTRSGEQVAQDTGIIELGEVDRMMVVAEVYESDISKVKIGQQVTISSESGVFQDELTGKVRQIGLQIGKKDVLDTDPAADIDTRVVEVKIYLDDESSKKVTGLTYSRVIAKIKL
jgi:HlyD family secretion protein